MSDLANLFTIRAVGDWSVAAGRAATLELELVTGLEFTATGLELLLFSSSGFSPKPVWRESGWHVLEKALTLPASSAVRLGIDVGPVASRLSGRHGLDLGGFVVSNGVKWPVGGINGARGASAGPFPLTIYSDVPNQGPNRSPVYGDLTWPQAEVLARAGGRVWRGTSATWFIDYTGFLAHRNVINVTTGALVSRAVVQGGDFGEAEFRATDWRATNVDAAAVTAARQIAARYP